jgi:hypothetical protein
MDERLALERGFESLVAQLPTRELAQFRVERRFDVLERRFVATSSPHEERLHRISGAY